MNELFAALMSICFIFSSVPQIRQILRTKSVEDINLTSCWIACTGNVFAILSCLTMTVLPVMFLVNNVIFTVLSVTILCVCIKYKKKQ